MGRDVDDARRHGTRLSCSVARALDDLGRRFGLGGLPIRVENMP